MKIKKHKSKPRPKPKIDYPPVPLKTWIPPDQRPKKKPKPKYVKPAELTCKLDDGWSTLVKIWHNFRIYGERAILTGNFSQNYRRYTYRSAGYQGPCNCFVAIAYSRLLDITEWCSATLDKILDIGDSLYLRTMHILGDNYKKTLKLCEVYHTYYIDSIKVTMDIKGKKYTGKILPDLDDTPHLVNVLATFFETQQSGILNVGEIFFAVFKLKKCYYLFDPMDHDKDGSEWLDLVGHGYSLLTKVANIASLIPVVQENLKCMDNPRFILHPCNLARKVFIARQYPCCMEYGNLELKFPPSRDKNVETTREDSKVKTDDTANIEFVEGEGHVPFLDDDDDDDDVDDEEGEEAQGEEAPADAEVAPGDAGDDEKPEAEAMIQTRRRPEGKAPIEKAKAASVTYFLEVIPEKMGILRASTHQCDPKFSKYLGKQGIANATAAVGMLRIYKSKYWTNHILDDTLKLGEVIYHDSMKALRLSGDTTLKVTTVCKIITINEKPFAPKIEDHTVIGRLNSQSDDLIDLLPALREFFADNDACILCGPVILAVWLENEMYYMFDPNERDEHALTIIKQVQIGSFLQVYDVPPGLACLTWYANLKDLVDVYMKNVPKAQKMDRFSLCRIQVDDYVELPEAWHNFQCLCDGKWILKGNFSQNNRRYSKDNRNTQCTAMAAMCVAMKELKPVKEWQTDTLDQILDVGDRYYEACVNHLKDKGMFVSPMLMLSELLPKYILDDKELNFEIDECLVNGNISYADNDEIANLKVGFKKFFEDYDVGILTCRSQSVTVWKQDEIFFCFDSHARDDNGMSAHYGTSMAMRITTMDDLIHVILGNLEPNTNSLYNISRVDVQIVDAGAGIPKPPLNNFAALDDNTAILRSTISQNDPKFKINVDKQTVPNNLAALGMSMVYPVMTWTKDTMDEILDIGDKLYVESMEAAIEAEEKAKEEAMAPVEPPAPPPPEPQAVEEPPPDDKKKKGKKKKEEPPPPPPPEPEPVAAPEVIYNEDQDSDDITMEKVVKEFKIGLNNFKMEEANVQQGTYADLAETLNNMYVPPPMEPEMAPSGDAPPIPPLPQQAPINQPAGPVILESELLTVAIWQEDGLYYVFDPKPRDPSGQVYGKDEWSLLPPPEPEPEPSPEQDAGADTKSAGEASDREHSEDIQDLMNIDISSKSDAPAPPAENPPDAVLEEGREAATVEGPADDEDDDDEFQLGEEEAGPPAPPPKPKHSPSYWLEQELQGRAYTMRFLRPEDMVRHIVENTPPKKGEIPYKLIELAVTNEVKTKDIYDPELGPPEDKYSGDWCAFKEIDHGRWILRGTMTFENEILPEMNRGRQQAAISFVALAYASLYSIPKFTQRSVDDILIYGDRLHTFTLNARRKELKDIKEVNLADEDIEQIVEAEEMGILNTTKHFCIATDKCRLEIKLDEVQGEINAQDLEEELDVKRGLEKFFRRHKAGLISAKNILLAIWRRAGIFYMYDPHSRGPSGLVAVNGVACITRYLDIEEMTQVFIATLCRRGDNRFFIHSVKVNIDHCPREEVRKKRVKVESTLPISSFEEVVPGKLIVRGNISQEDPMFGRRLNAQFCPMAYVALAMTLVHRAMFWTKPIVDEIITIGDQLYGTALDDLGFQFNPWEQVLTLDNTPTDFKIGALKVNCELRANDERGIVNVKNSSVYNLRQGIEKFFEENTHGIIETEALTLAIWEETEPTVSIYMFDPCGRGPSGMPMVNGTACVINFQNAKSVADHFIALTPENGNAEFTIRPVEIVVGKMKTKGRKKVEDCPPKPKMIVVGQQIGTAADKKKTKQMLAAAKKKKDELRRRKLGKKKFYKIPGTEISILRGNKHLGCASYSVYSRFNQAIPTCLTAYIMERLLPFDKWSCKIIDMVLDVGDQLYKDSYLMYSPKSKQLGLNCVVREIIIKDVLVNIAIGRPVLISQFSVSKVETALELCFRQKNYCMLSIYDRYLAVFYKDDHYYVFDPYGLNAEAKKEGIIEACLVKFKDLNTLASIVVENYTTSNENVFTVILVAIKCIRRMPKRKVSDTATQKSKESVHVQIC